MSIFMKELDFSFYKRFFIYNYKIKKFIKKRLSTNRIQKVKKSKKNGVNFNFILIFTPFYFITKFSNLIFKI